MSESFASPDTHFHVITSDTPPSVDGFAIGEPTGEIRCCECGATHLNVDEIPHDAGCSQRFVRSRWWTDHLQDG